MRSAAPGLSPFRVLLASTIARLGVDGAFARYVGVSAVALAADMASLDRLLVVGWDHSVAAAVAYSVGIVVHWLLSTRFVFSAETAMPGSGERDRQKLMFLGSAFVGLTLTTAIVGSGSALGIEPRIAKLFAIAASFFTVWLLRRLYIFAR